MMNLNTGISGAKVQSWKEDNPRSVLKRIIEHNPKADKPKILEMCSEELRKDEGMIDTVIEYWFTRNYRCLLEGATPRQMVVASRAAKQAVKQAAVEKIKATIKARAVRMVLGEVVLPNGKTLNESTGKDCGKAGGWFKKIASQIKPNEIVRKVLSEAQLRKLYSQA